MLETSLDRHAASARLGRIVDWFKAHERPLLVIGAAAQVIVLAGMIAMRSIPFLAQKPCCYRSSRLTRATCSAAIT